jgi:hypothetical protein
MFEVLTVVIVALKIEAVSTFQMSVNLYETVRRSIPQDGHICVLVCDTV